MGGGTGQVMVPGELWDDLSTQILWKRGNTEMFDIRTINLDAGFYLRMAPEKSLSKVYKYKKDKYLHD